MECFMGIVLNTRINPMLESQPSHSQVAANVWNLTWHFLL